MFGNFPPADHVVDSVVQQLKSGKKNGYAKSVGKSFAHCFVIEHAQVCGGTSLHLLLRDVGTNYARAVSKALALRSVFWRDHLKEWTVSMLCPFPEMPRVISF